MAIIDIIVGVKNEEKYIERCIKSLMEQTIKEINIIVVDGLSDDGTPEIVSKLMEGDPRISLLTNSQENISSGRNIGLNSSNAEYVAYLDGHAYVDRDWIETLYTSYKENELRYNLAGVGSTYASPEDDSSFARTVAYCLQTIFGGLGTSYTRENIVHEVGTVAFALYKRSILEDEGVIYDENMTHCEDTDFNHQLVKKDYILLKHPKARVYQYRRETIGKFFQQMMNYGEGRMILVKKYKDELKWYHLLPVIAIFYLLFLLISLILFILNQMNYYLLIINTYLLIIILTPLFLYLIIDLIYTLKIIVQQGSLKYLQAFIVFPVVHVGYGIGFLKGLIN